MSDDGTGGLHAQRVASAILEKVRSVDATARIQSITPSSLFSHGGGVVVRVSPGDASGSRLCQLIQRTWRLTTCTAVDCSISGSTVVQVFVPGGAEMHESALTEAKTSSRIVRWISVAIKVAVTGLVFALYASFLSVFR